MSYDTHNAPFDLNTDTIWTRRAEGLAPANADTEALLRAAKEGDAAKIRVLVENGADADARDAHGWTAIFWAVKNRHVKAVAELITHGASVNIEARNGFTPLSVAVKSGSPLIISVITQAGGGR